MLMMTYVSPTGQQTTKHKINEYENEKMTKATTAGNDSGGLKSLNGKLGVERQK
jgi:hypothetical protein